MNTFHKNIGKRWHEYSIFEQMANIGSEVERAIQWKGRNTEYSTLAFLRSMELLSYTIEDKKNRMRLKELTRLSELLGDYFLGDNLYHSSDSLWTKYFMPFTIVARTHAYKTGNKL